MQASNPKNEEQYVCCGWRPRTIVAAALLNFFAVGAFITLMYSPGCEFKSAEERKAEAFEHKVELLQERKLWLETIGKDSVMSLLEESKADVYSLYLEERLNDGIEQEVEARRLKIMLPYERELKSVSFQIERYSDSASFYRNKLDNL